MREEWKFVLMGCGAQYVVGSIHGRETGISGMLELCVDNWDMIQVSFITFSITEISTTCLLCTASILPSHYLYLSSRTKVHLFYCGGNENLLIDCDHRHFYNRYCYTTAEVVCYSKLYNCATMGLLYILHTRMQWAN